MRSGVQTMEKEVDILKGEGGQHPTAARPVDAVHELISFASLSLTGLIISVRVPRAIVFKKKIPPFTLVSCLKLRGGVGASTGPVQRSAREALH